MFSKRPQSTAVDKLKAYHLAVERCYPKRQSVSIEFFRLSCFNGFNSERGLPPERKYLFEDAFELEGVVGGWVGESSQVPVLLTVHGTSDRFMQNASIGSYCLNHYGPEGGDLLEKPLRLDVSLSDPKRFYQSCLRDAMRDAAVSGKGFLHVEIHGLTPDPEETKSPSDLIQERGYGPAWSFNELKVWPAIFLSNAPQWAVNCHGPFK